MKELVAISKGLISQKVTERQQSYDRVAEILFEPHLLHALDEEEWETVVVRFCTFAELEKDAWLHKESSKKTAAFSAKGETRLQSISKNLSHLCNVALQTQKFDLCFQKCLEHAAYAYWGEADDKFEPYSPHVKLLARILSQKPCRDHIRKKIWNHLHASSRSSALAAFDAISTSKNSSRHYHPDTADYITILRNLTIANCAEASKSHLSTLTTCVELLSVCLIDLKILLIILELLWDCIKETLPDYFDDVKALLHEVIPNLMRIWISLPARDHQRVAEIKSYILLITRLSLEMITGNSDVIKPIWDMCLWEFLQCTKKITLLSFENILPLMVQKSHTSVSGSFDGGISDAFFFYTDSEIRARRPSPGLGLARIEFLILVFVIYE
ncbi:hypothetical protein HDU67_009024 [Dinochytrium kinnereticum]|nr:hypothetical protein HDU67_009024 [Dinochytrium kinnereticum]